MTSTLANKSFQLTGELLRKWLCVFLSHAPTSMIHTDSNPNYPRVIHCVSGTSKISQFGSWDITGKGHFWAKQVDSVPRNGVVSAFLLAHDVVILRHQPFDGYLGIARQYKQPISIQKREGIEPIANLFDENFRSLL